MQKKALMGLRAPGNWIQGLLEVRLPVGLMYGLRNR